MELHIVQNGYCKEYGHKDAAGRMGVWGKNSRSLVGCGRLNMATKPLQLLVLRSRVDFHTPWIWLASWLALNNGIYQKWCYVNSRAKAWLSWNAVLRLPYCKEGDLLKDERPTEKNWGTLATWYWEAMLAHTAIPAIIWLPINLQANPQNYKK